MWLQVLFGVKYLVKKNNGVIPFCPKLEVGENLGELSPLPSLIATSNRI